MSGLKEDLGFEGNQLVVLQTLYTVGAVVGQLPFLFVFTHVPMYWLVPFLDISWGIFTLLQYRATSFAELAAYRFLVGWFEVISDSLSQPRGIGGHSRHLLTMCPRLLSFPPCTTSSALGTAEMRSHGEAVSSTWASRWAP